MRLETERLHLIPLTANQLNLWLNRIELLEAELNCSYQAEPLTGFFAEIVKSQLEITENHKTNYLYHTFWFLVRKSDRVVVGAADFKNVPDNEGQVEIGYGLGENFQHCGYMTEAIKSMCEWAFDQPNIRSVIAETEPDNSASHKVLERCGFNIYSKADNFWWKAIKNTVC
jgi:[ribosomal protein S5]-alanine N-acetyltransferase